MSTFRPSPEATPRILLAEDNTDDEGMTLRALRTTVPGAFIEVVRNGKDAVERLLKCTPENRPDLVLLDIRMPMLSGLEVLKIVRSSDSCRAVPIIMLTASDEDRDINTAYDLGANSYVQKPIASDEFLTKVGALGLYWTDSHIGPRDG